VEINLVTYIEPHTDRTDMSFQSAPRVQRSHHVLGTQIIHAAEERSHRRRRRIESRVQETAFQSYKRMKIGVAKRHFGPEQSVQQPEIRSIDDDAPAAREIFGKDLIEVVAHLSFQHYAMAKSHAEPDTNPGKIRIRLREPEIVRIGSDREVVLRKYRRCRRYAAQQEKQRNTPHLASHEQFRLE